MQGIARIGERGVAVMEGPRVRCAVVLAMLVLLLAVSAGCIGGPDAVADRDIVVLKLGSDGTPQWTRTVDTGQDDGAEDLVELPGGGFAIAARNGSDPRHPARPRFIRLSPDGTVAWDRFDPEGFDTARAVVPTGDGGTAVLTGNGTVVRFDPEGRTLWARATGISGAQALLPLADGGFVAGGRITYHTSTNITVPPTPDDPVRSLVRRVLGETPNPSTAVPVTAGIFAGEEGMAVRLSADGGTVWEGRYGEGGLDSAQSLVESPDGTGLLLVGYGAMPGANATAGVPLLALRLAPDGMPLPATQLGTAAFPAGVRTGPGGYRVLYRTARPTVDFPRGSVVDAALDRDGRVLERRSIGASTAVTWTADGGYFSVGIPFGEGESGYGDTTSTRAAASTFRALRFDSTGALVRDQALPTGLISQVKKVVQTADGGYAVLALRTIE